MHLISFIIPTYNSCDLLKRCISSILKIKAANIEIIVIDDGSSDGTKELIESMNSQKVKYFYQENSGVSAARNRGISISEGDYIFFIDADDEFNSNEFESVLLELEKSECELYIFSHLVIKGKKIKHQIYPNEVLSLDIKDNLQSIVSLPIGYVWNKLYKKSIIVENSIVFDKELKYGEDFHFNLVFLSYIRSIRVSSKIFYHYYLNKGTASRRFNPNFEYVLLKLNEVYAKLCENIDDFDAYYERRNNPFKFNMLLLELRNAARKDNQKYAEFKGIVLKRKDLINNIGRKSISGGINKFILFILKTQNIMLILLMFMVINKMRG